MLYQQLSNHIRDLHDGDWQPNGPREARLCGYWGRTPMEEHVEGEMMTLFWWMPPKSHCPHQGEEWWRNTQLDCWRTSQGLYGLKDFGFQGLQSDDVNRWKAAMQKTLHSKIKSKAQSVILDKNYYHRPVHKLRLHIFWILCPPTSTWMILWKHSTTLTFVLGLRLCKMTSKSSSAVANDF